MKDLEARKKLLVAESEVYRQTLRLDAQNLRLYSAHIQRKFATYAALKPAILLAAPLVSSWFSGKGKNEEHKPKSFFSMAMSGFRMYKSLQPLLASLMAQYGLGSFNRAAQETGAREDEEPAATI
jgi:hypothetical protein